MINEETEIQHAESQLREAMLASNVDMLDRLIDEQLLFVDPSGHLLSKQEDMQHHQSGEQRFTRLHVLTQVIRATSKQASVSVVAEVAGIFKQQVFQGRFRYLRVWSKTSDQWRIIAGSVTAIPSE
jgi:uncharacterized protein YchJ